MHRSNVEGSGMILDDDKARRELGYAPRDFETGLREMLAAL